MRAIFLILITFTYCLNVTAQEKVSFSSSDNLKVTADLYLKDNNLPFIVLCHQANSSRGEYIEIAQRLLKLGYNCLAIDLRSGESMNFVKNETAELAKKENKPHSLLDAIKDIEASLQFVRKFNKQPVILFGSSYTASLCLVVAKNTPDIKAVIAFSPGEFFRPEIVIKDVIVGLKIPVFVSVTSLEYDYVLQILAGVDNNLATIYKPAKGNGVHGAKALWQTSETSDECWFELLLFFKKIKEYKYAS